MYFMKYLLPLLVFLVLFGFVIGKPPRDPVTLSMEFKDEFGDDVSLVMEGGIAVATCETYLIGCSGNADLFKSNGTKVGTAPCEKGSAEIRFNITNETEGNYTCRYGNESSKAIHIQYRLCADDGIHCKSSSTCKEKMCVWSNGKYDTCQDIPRQLCNIHSEKFVCTETRAEYSSLCDASSAYSTVRIEQSVKACDTDLPAITYSATSLKFKQPILLDNSTDNIQFLCPGRMSKANMTSVLKNSKGEIVHSQTGGICNIAAYYNFTEGLATNGTQVFQLTSTFKKDSDITRTVYRLVVINAKVTINQTMNKKNSTYTDKLQCNVPHPRVFNATYTWFGNTTARLEETTKELSIEVDGTYRCEVEIKYVTCYMGTDDIKRTFQSGKITVKAAPPALHDVTTIISKDKPTDNKNSSEGLKPNSSNPLNDKPETTESDDKKDWSWLWGLLGDGIVLFGGGLGYLYNKNKKTKAAERELKNQRQNIFEKKSKGKGKGEATATDPAAKCRKKTTEMVGKYDNQLLHEKNSGDNGDMDIETFEPYALKLLTDDNFLDTQYYIHMTEVNKMLAEVHISHHTVKIPGVRHPLRIFRPTQLALHNAPSGEMLSLHASMFQTYEGYLTSLCQAPLVNEFDDFIHSLVQYRMGTIVLVGDMEEQDEKKKLQGGSTKAPPERKIDEYFSLNEGGKKDTENYTVKTVGVFNEPGCNIYRLLIADRDKSGTKKEKEHFTATAVHINNWRDHSAPENYEGVAKAIVRIDSILDNQTKQDLYNMTIHCSAGMQRSASVLCMLFCLQRYKADGKINMLQVMKYLARNRAGALGKSLAKDKLKLQMKVIAKTMPLVIQEYKKFYHLK